MTVVKENDIGMITIEEEAIARIAGLSTISCYGIVGMATKNVKDLIVKILRKENITKGVKLSIQNEKLIINLYIIVKYGTNLKTVAGTIINTVKYKVEKATGIKVSHINIFIEGIKIND